MYQHQEFSIDINLEIVTVHALHIFERMNEHAELNLSGICRAVQNRIPEKQAVTVMDRNGSIIFCGRIHDIKLKYDKEFLSFQLKAYSASCEMDGMKRRRVFQDLDMTYEQILFEVLKSYKSSSHLDQVTNGAKIPHSIVQFDETDWEFLKRLSSHFNTGIWANCKSSSIQLFFGASSREKGILEGEELTNNTNLLKEQEQLTIKTHKQAELGCRISYKGSLYLIKSTESLIKRGELFYQSLLERTRGASFPYLPNTKLAGLHLWAVVKEINRNKLRVKYPIEDYAQGNTPWLPFAGEENNEAGYYMPEPGDEVEVTFPDLVEAHAFISAARRRMKQTNPEKHNMKYLRNKEGIGLYMDEEKLSISSGMERAAIVMHQDGGIHIKSSETLHISAESDLEIGGRTGNVTIHAEDSITFQSGETGASKITFDSDSHISCKALQQVVVSGSGIVSDTEETSGQANTGISSDKVRNAVMALSGVEFLSKSAAGTMDTQDAQKIMNHLLGRDMNEIGTEASDDNWIKQTLFENNERLFNSFSYGESKRG